MRQTVTKALTDHGLRVEAVEDGQQALDRVRKGGISLVILDIIMPKLSGIECCRIIKSVAEERILPVLLLTSKTDIESRLEGLRIGADDYVGKPFDERELLARVDNLLQGEEGPRRDARQQKAARAAGHPGRADRALQLSLHAHPARRRVQARPALPLPAGLRDDRHRPFQAVQRHVRPRRRRRGAARGRRTHQPRRARNRRGGALRRRGVPARPAQHSLRRRPDRRGPRLALGRRQAGQLRPRSATR